MWHNYKELINFTRIHLMTTAVNVYDLFHAARMQNNTETDKETNETPSYTLLFPLLIREGRRH